MAEVYIPGVPFLHGPAYCKSVPLYEVMGRGFEPTFSDEVSQLPTTLKAIYVICSVCLVIFGFLTPSCDLPASKRTALKVFKIHNNVNLVLMPIILVSIALSTCGVIPDHLTSWMMLSYMIFDGTWTIINPEIVPSNEKIVIRHHLVTLLLVAAPLHYAQLRFFTDWMSLVELNTFLYFLSKLGIVKKIAILNFLVQAPFWATLVGFRMIVQPLSLYYIATMVCEGYEWPLSCRIVCFASALFLIFFNVWWINKRVVGTMLRKEKTT